MRVLDLRQLCVVGVCEDIRVTVCVGEGVYHEQQEERMGYCALFSFFFSTSPYIFISVWT